MVSSRVIEGLLSDLVGLQRNWRETKDYVVIVLLGRVKVESSDAAHVIPCAHPTDSRINFKSVSGRLIEEKGKTRSHRWSRYF